MCFYYPLFYSIISYFCYSPFSHFYFIVLLITHLLQYILLQSISTNNVVNHHMSKVAYYVHLFYLEQAWSYLCIICFMYRLH